MDKFFAAVQNMFRIPELRTRILFTLGMLAIYRLGAHVTAPGINKARLEQVWQDVAGTLLGVLDLFSGGNFRTISVFALGVTPYITASIIMQLMPVLYPAMKKIQEEGEVGRQKMNQWTRYLTVVLCTVQTFFVATWLKSNAIISNEWWATFMIVITLTTGTIFVMWLGEQITERGVGTEFRCLFCGYRYRIAECSYAGFRQARRRRPASDARRYFPCGSYGRARRIDCLCRISAAKCPDQLRESACRKSDIPRQETSLPLKINMGGVIPVIFASSVLAMPQTIFSALPPDPNNPNTLWAKIYAFSSSFAAATRIMNLCLSD